MSTIVKIELGMIAAAVVGFVLLALTARALQLRGVIPDQASMQRRTFPFLMGLFVLFGFGLIGLGIHAFIVGQGGIGNQDVGIIAFVRNHQTGVTLGFWAFLLLGFLIAYPFMRRDMLSPTTTAQQPQQHAAKQSPPHSD